MSAGDKAVHRKTLVAATEDVVTFPRRVNIVEIISDGAGDLFGTSDGSPATIDGPNCFRLPGGVISSIEVSGGNESPTVVRLISTAATTYSVQQDF